MSTRIGTTRRLMPIGAALAMLLTAAPAQAVTVTTIRPAWNPTSPHVLFAGTMPSGAPGLIPGGAAPRFGQWVFPQVNRGQTYRGYVIQSRSSGQCLTFHHYKPPYFGPCPPTSMASWLQLWKFYIGPISRQKEISPYSPYASNNWVRIQNSGGGCLAVAPSAQYVPNTPLAEYACRPDERYSWRLFTFDAP